ncbi:MAG TPA: glycosyltransferase family 4 protein [Vicinamibacterales bacterium]|jgi:glycosyltransferase involved in cell wall biosynthesis|nr:glycosyltransferase family 4 protein [Vicinamibacterales bacterium]
MRILMIAPEPFFEPRGTPFSEYHRIRALLELGHTVDLVTYPFGRDISMRGLRVFRSLRPPFVRDVGIGPSWRKVPLDLLVTLTTIRRALAGGYDAVHSHEEGSWFGVVIASMLGVPHLYDMHSSLPQQLQNFAYSRSRVLTSLFTRFERFVVRRSRVVIVICPQLEEVVRAIDPAVPSVLIENAPGAAETAKEGSGTSVRAALQLRGDTPLVLYTGTFEAYQGLDLLFRSMGPVLRVMPAARLVLAGGRPEQIEAARRAADALGISAALVFAGQRPAEEIPSFLDAADVLVSPRSLGTNTPLKIYQYLQSGKPIVATRLLTHTQVLDDSVAFLTEATPDAFGAGILRALSDRDEARRVGARARELSETKYSYDAYLARTRQACAHLFGEPAAQVAGGVA